MPSRVEGASIAERPPGAEDEPPSAWESADEIPWERDLITLFVRNQTRVVLAMPLLALLFAAVSLLWTSALNGTSWFLAAAGCQAIQFHLCRGYLAQPPRSVRLTDWIGMLAASEFLIGACWSLPLFIFWAQASDLQHVYLIATVMTVIAVRIVIAANFMPAIIAGTGFMTFNVVIRCILEADPLYVALGAMSLALEVFLIQIAVRLQATARDMLIFKAQKERLIDELKLEREQAEAARLKAEEASRAKSRFLATMSHELRTPLNAILGFSEVLSLEMFGPHQIEAYKAYAHDIKTSGTYLLNLVNDLLDLSHLEAGRHDLEEEPVALGASLEAALNIVAFKAGNKSQAVRLDAPAILPKLMADRRALKQIWLNLLSNAIKFTPAGGAIDIAAERTEGGGLNVAIRDNGPGIPPQELAAVTSAFGRGSFATSRAIEGAGLGLALVKGLVALHGGELHIRSRPGLGTEAIVGFPAARVLAGPRGQVLAAPTVTSGQRKLLAVTGFGVST